jgi:adenylosuccinate synthase
MKKSILLYLLFVSFTSVEALTPKGAYVVVSAGSTDDGKGKMCDWLATDAHFFVRSQGSSSTGHTVNKNGKVFVLYYVPVGILTPSVKKCYLAPGMLIDPGIFFKELKGLESQGITVRGRVRVSTAAHLMMPYHRLIDALSHKTGGRRVAGGVRSGSGAATADKRMGVGIRIADLMGKNFPTILKESLQRANEVITKIHKKKPLDYNSVLKVFLEYKKAFEPYVRDRVELKINQLISQQKRGIFEGSHGTFLDITHGTYPYTSAASTTAAGIISSAGIGPTRITHTLGVVKAYTTHLGKGPFPTEIKDGKVAQVLRNAVAATSPELYRFGWLDAVMVRQAIMLNGMDSIAISRLDDLDKLEKIRVCIDYDLKDNPTDKESKHFDYPPPRISQLRKVTPHYFEFEGWQEKTQGAKDFSELPIKARVFIKKLEALFGVDISLISVGPGRDQTIMVKDFFS